jgi:anti-anti-sigma factor
MQQCDGGSRHTAATRADWLIVDGRPTVRGDCDVVTAPNIEAWLATFDSRPLEVDLSGVTHLDYYGLRTLLCARDRNPNMRVINPSKAVRKLLEMTGTVEYLI